MTRMAFIDGNSIGYASQNTTRLSAGDRETQAIFGFFRSLRTLMASYPGISPLVLWDGRAQWRYDLYPGYKDRQKDAKSQLMKEKYEDQKPDILRGLELLGVRQLTDPHNEADDLAGVMTSKAVKAGNDVVLVTGDKDWIQLVGERVTWFDPIRERQVTQSNFAEFTGFATVEQFVQAKALTGDTSDTIKGVGGIGEKGAADFMMQYGTVDAFFKMADSGSLPAKLPLVLSRFANNERPPKCDTPMRDAYRRNMKIMDLRSPTVSGPEVMKVVKGKFDKEGFADLCAELSFTSILANYDAWLAPFTVRS